MSKPASSNPKESAKAFPETNTPSVKELADRFNASGKLTVTEQLKRAVMIAEAHEYYGQKALDEFFHQIGLDRTSATARKMRKIGEKAARFENQIDLLSDDWTTLHYLATLGDEQYQKLVDDKILSRSVTLAKIRGHLDRASGTTRDKPKRLVIDLHKIEVRRSDFAKKLKGLLEEYQVLSEETIVSTLVPFIVEDSKVGDNA